MECIELQDDTSWMPASWDRLKPVLSYSELATLRHLFKNMVYQGDKENVYVVSASQQLNEKNRITRTSSVQGFRFLEAAGLAKTRSLGRNGTQIHVLWLPLIEAIQED